MSIQISKSRKGTTIRARGIDAHALFNALCRSAGEPELPAPEAAEENKADGESNRAAREVQS